jgi:hypothetical protein
MAMLTPGSTFPDIKLTLVGGARLSLPADISGSWAYIAFYRGGW